MWVKLRLTVFPEAQIWLPVFYLLVNVGQHVYSVGLEGNLKAMVTSAIIEEIRAGRKHSTGVGIHSKYSTSNKEHWAFTEGSDVATFITSGGRAQECTCHAEAGCTNRVYDSRTAFPASPDDPPANSISSQTPSKGMLVLNTSPCHSL